MYILLYYIILHSIAFYVTQGTAIEKRRDNFLRELPLEIVFRRQCAQVTVVVIDGYDCYCLLYCYHIVIDYYGTVATPSPMATPSPSPTHGNGKHNTVDFYRWYCAFRSEKHNTLTAAVELPFIPTIEGKINTKLNK